MTNPANILVLLPTWVGDFVMATPFLRALRTFRRDAKITFLMESNLRDLACGGPWMDECLEWPEKARRTPLFREYRGLIRELRRRRFDWAILLPNSFRAALAARLAGAKRRIGYDRDGRGLLLTDRVPVANRRNGRYEPRPLVEYYADLAEAVGCPRPDDCLELFTTPEDERDVEERLRSLDLANRHPLIVICPGARYGVAKLWLPERFAAVADRLIETHQAAVVVACGPGEEPIARAIVAAMTGKGRLLENPLPSLGSLKALIRRCDLLLCTDAGPRHVGKAFQVPIVTVFGPTHPTWTATNYPRERIARIDVECGPCQRRICPLGHHQCMTGLSADRVYQFAHELLQARECSSS